MKENSIFLAIAVSVYIPFSNVASCADTVLTLRECQERALNSNLALPPLEAEINTQDGLIEQAGYSPNPQLEFEAENLLGTGGFQGVDGVETTLGISQVIETGGKRDARASLARRHKERAFDQLAIARLNILHKTNQSFIDVVFAQERLKLEASFYELIEKTYETIRATVEAGRDSPMEETRAKVMASSSRITLERIQRTLEKQRLILASQWSSDTPAFDSVDGALLPLPSIPALEQSLEMLERHPDIVKANNEIGLRESNLDLEIAKAVPNVEVAAGVRYLSDGDDAAFVLGFSIPLPFRDRNQGAIRAARHQIGQANHLQDQMMFDLKSKLAQSYKDYQMAFHEAGLLSKDIIPNAQLVYESAMEGYRQGKFSYLNALEAQRSLFELQIQLLDVAVNVHKAINEIHFITGNYGDFDLSKKENES